MRRACCRFAALNAAESFGTTLSPSNCLTSLISVPKPSSCDWLLAPAADPSNMAAAAKHYDLDLDDDTSEACGFSEDDEGTQPTDLAGDSGAAASEEASGANGSDAAAHSIDGNGAADGATASAAREGRPGACCIVGWVGALSVLHNCEPCRHWPARLYRGSTVRP